MKNGARKDKDGTITSVEDAIKTVLNEPDSMRDIEPDDSAIAGDSNFGLWFRGQGNAMDDLTPGMLRRHMTGVDDGYIEEFSFCRHFQSLNPEATPRGASDFERLVLMQHYSAPTRLLDWTENLLVALYFAVRNPDKDGQKDSALWVLNGRNLNWFSSATESQSRIAWPSDPDVIARSCLSRVLGRREWYDVFTRELVRVRCDRSDVCQRRIMDVIGNKKVGLAADSLNDPTVAAYDLRRFNWIEDGKPQPPLDFYADGRGESSDVGLYTRLRMPVAVFPERTNPRIARQTGVFTLHGGKLPQRPDMTEVHDDVIGRPITIEEIEAMKPKDDVQARTWRRIVKWFFIPKDKRAGIRKTLAQIGISEATLFPELDYQSQHLRERWTHVRAKH